MGACQITSKNEGVGYLQGSNNIVGSNPNNSGYIFGNNSGTIDQSGDGSNVKGCNTRSSEPTVLLVLKSYEISHLFDKFCEANITHDVIWDLDDDMLDEAKLTKIEKLQYQKAKAKAKLKG